MPLSAALQVVLGDAIVDFLVPAARLIVEVEGACHRARATADASRDRKLARLGYRVIRLDADEVLGSLPVALALIRQALAR